MSFEELYEIAKSVVRPVQLSEFAKSGSVGSAILTIEGNVYTGVSIETECGMGFCAEHSAAATMITNGENHIVKIIAVGKSGNIMPPCGRCREFLRQLHNDNLKAQVKIDENTIVSLRELLPYEWKKGNKK